MAGIFRMTKNGDYNAFDYYRLDYYEASDGSTRPLDAPVTGNFTIGFVDGSLYLSAPGYPLYEVTYFFSPYNAGVQYGTGGFYFDFSDGTGPVEFQGSLFGDVLVGGAGGDRLLGADGDDTLDGGSGDDAIVGGAGDDTLTGGLGNDRFDDFLGDNLIDGGRGTDTLSFAGGGRVMADMMQGYAVLSQGDRYVISNFTSVENLIGSSNNDRLSGDQRANQINGGDGADQIDGAAGNDALFGAQGRDILKGGDGSDRLVGGEQADTLTGGAGADVFVYKDVAASGTTAAQRDRIIDFSRAQGDRIDLSDIDADPSRGGNQAFDFVRNFSGDGGELRVTASGNAWLVQADIDGDRHADFAILVESPTALTAADFMV